MKRTLYTIVGLLIPFMLFSQERQLPEFGANIEQVIKKTPANYKTDSLGYRLKSISVDYKSGGVWTFSDSILYTYSGVHDHGDIDQMMLNNFIIAPEFDELLWLDFDGLIWVNYAMGTQIFNAEGLAIENQFMIWSGTNWEKDVRYIYTWDAEGRLIQNTFQWWTGSVYENSSLNEYIYGPFGIDERIYYYWSGSDWTNADKDVYTYNGFGELEYITNYYWNGTDWVNDYRIVFYYNPDGLLEEELQQQYGMGWVNSWRILYTYNASGFLLEELEQTWTGSTWEDAYRHTAILGVDNLPDYVMYEWWDGTVWQDYYRFRYTYEEFDDGTVAIPEMTISYAMKIFPNPAHRNVNVMVKSQVDAIAEMQLRDMTGQLIGRMNVPLNLGENIIPLDLQAMGVMSGEYIVSLRTGSKTFVGKLLVQ